MSEPIIQNKRSVDSLEVGIKLFAVFLVELWLYDLRREHIATFQNVPAKEALWFHIACVTAAVIYPITIARFTWDNAKAALVIAVLTWCLFGATVWAFQVWPFYQPHGWMNAQAPTLTTRRALIWACLIVAGLVARRVLLSHRRPTAKTKTHQ